MARRWERLGGALIALLGVGLTWFTWRIAQTGRPFPAAGCAAPGFATLGAALVLFPGYRSERLARGEDLAGLDGVALLTLRWRVVLLIATAASIGFWAWMKFG